MYIPHAAKLDYLQAIKTRWLALFNDRFVLQTALLPHGMKVTASCDVSASFSNRSGVVRMIDPCKVIQNPGVGCVNILITFLITVL